MNLMTSLGESAQEKPEKQVEKSTKRREFTKLKKMFIHHKKQEVTFEIEDGKNIARIVSTKEDYPYELVVPSHKYQEYLDGKKHIQHIFPEMSPDVREFLISGIAGKEWNDLFGEIEE